MLLGNEYMLSQKLDTVAGEESVYTIFLFSRS